MTYKPTYFSDHFKIDKVKLQALGVFDPILNFDTKLFVEPLLLKNSKSKIISNSANTYNKFFTNLLKLLKHSQYKGDKCWRAAKQQVYFPEYKNTCIGYGSTSIHGSGSGSSLHEKILESAKEIVDIAKNDADIFLLLPLLEEGIGADIISDMTQNIINDDICQYTVSIMEQLNITGNMYSKTKSGAKYKLCKNPFSQCSIKLLPTDILSELPLADTFDSWAVEASSKNTHLRQAVNQYIGNTWLNATKREKKELLIDKIKTDKSFFLEILKELKNSKFNNYDLDEDKQGLYRWLKDSEQFIVPTGLADKVNSIASLDQLIIAVQAIIMHFKAVIEDQEVWRIFWTKQGKTFKHVTEFYSQMLFFVTASTWLRSQNSNIQLSRLFNKTTKKFELQFISAKKYTVVVDIKHSNNYSGLEKGYLQQLEYANQENTAGIYVVIDTTESETEQLQQIKRLQQPSSKIIEIDIYHIDPPAHQESSLNISLPELEELDLDDFKLDIEPIALDASFDKEPFISFDELDITDGYTQEKSKGGRNSYQRYKPLKNKVTEICQAELDNKKYSSASRLCQHVAKLLVQQHMELLNNFTPYQQFQADNADWTKPTLYKWCNEIYKQHSSL